LPSKTRGLWGNEIVCGHSPISIFIRFTSSKKVIPFCSILVGEENGLGNILAEMVLYILKSLGSWYIVCPLYATGAILLFPSCQYDTRGARLTEFEFASILEIMDMLMLDDGSLKPGDGTVSLWDGTVSLWDGTIALWDGTIALWDGTIALWDGTIALWDGTIALWDGTMSLWDGTIALWDGTVALWDGTIALCDGTMSLWDGTVAL
jgi:hypothetical protein